MPRLISIESADLAVLDILVWPSILSIGKTVSIFTRLNKNLVLRFNLFLNLSTRSSMSMSHLRRSLDQLIVLHQLPKEETGILKPAMEICSSDGRILILTAVIIIRIVEGAVTEEDEGLDSVEVVVILIHIGL